MNWEKFRSPARATFKYPNYPKSLCEFGKKIGSVRPRFKIPNLCANLNFTIENKMKNLQEPGHISN